MLNIYTKISLLSLLLYISELATGALPTGDLNGDNKVNLCDFQILATDWLSMESGPADLNFQDGINAADLEIMVSHWLENGIPLAINEFMASNSAFLKDPQDQFADWIEIYNYSAKPIDLAGMYLTDNLSIPNKSLVPIGHPEQTTVPAGGYLLLWADEDGVDGPTHLGFKLSANGESIGLYDSNLKLIDSIENYPTQTADNSYGRLPDGAGAWQTFSQSTSNAPTPGQSNDGLISDRNIIISEIMYHPSSQNDLEEYIELYNTGNFPISLKDWTINKGVSFNFPDITIAAHAYLVVAADQAAFSSKYPLVTNFVAGWSGHLANGSESIELINSQGEVIDLVTYSDDNQWDKRILGPLDYNHRGWLWSGQHDGLGKSLELINQNMPNEHGSNWQASIANQGTPGAENGKWLSDTAPIITWVRQAKIIPDATDSVDITASVIDEQATGIAVSLYYRMDQSVYSLNSYPTFDLASYTITPMLDDGLHNDGTAGDGVFGATIPPFADNTIIEYFVKAVDQTGNTSSFPAACIVDGIDQQVANRLYQVDNDFEEDKLWQATDMPVYYLIMTEAERGRLEYIGKTNPDRYSNAVMNCTFICVDGTDTKVRFNIDIRNRGESSRMYPPNNYRVSFNHNETVRGVSKLNLNSKYTYLQLAGAAIFQMADMPAADSAAVQVRVNGQNLALTDTNPTRMYGFYVRNEVIDDDWAEKHLPGDPDGNVYKASSSGWNAKLQFLGTNYLDYITAGYSKQTNEEINDWNDLFALTSVLEKPVSASYADDLATIANIDQWLRWFAIQSLIGNNETNLGNGYGDDYRMYRGMVDSRFILLSHDMDTVLGFGDSPSAGTDSIFRAANATRVPNIKRFLEYPQYTARYFKYLKEYSDTTFAAENIDPLLENLLGGYVPQSQIDAMKQFVVKRKNNVLEQIPQTFSISSDLTITNGWPTTTSATTELHGTANVLETQSVCVNGQLANWTILNGTWTTAQAVSLNPGLNRITVETYSTSDGSGEALKMEYFDIYYNDGDVSELAGTLTESLTLDAVNGPWQITADVVIPVGITLNIEPGTSLIFSTGSGITVNGMLNAQGTKYQRISMTRVPGSTSNWDGLKFSSTYQDNQLCYTDMHFGDSQGKDIITTGSKITLDNFSWNSTTASYLEGNGGQITIRNSYIPGSTTANETIHGGYLSGSEYLLLENNVFAYGSGSNDIIDWDPTGSDKDYIFAINNIFLGGNDDGIDLDGCDIYAEGNIFMNFNYESTETSTNALAGGESYNGSSNQFDLTAVRNIFVNCSNGILLKEGAYGIIVNNTFVNMKYAGIQLWEYPGRSVNGPAAGAYVAGNIFWNCPEPIKHLYCVDQYPVELTGYVNPQVQAEFNLFPEDMHYLGQGNIDADPQFINTKYSLSENSPARHNGPANCDIGADIPSGVTVSDIPQRPSWKTDMTLRAYGPGISHYKYRLSDNGNWGTWSSEIAISEPIVLNGLINGHEYALATRGRTSRGYWPGNPDGNISESWLVDISTNIMFINEVLAKTVADTPDMIELYYEGTNDLDISGYSISDNKSIPTKFIFPANTILQSGTYLTIVADPSFATENINCGFSLDGDGDGIYLYDTSGNLIDFVEFGTQLLGMSLSRDKFGSWKLSEPTLGLPNQFIPTGNPLTLKINEWLANANVAFTDDFIELFNPTNYPIDMTGLYLTDNPVTEKYKSRISAHSFIAANGYAVFIADGINRPGHAALHLDDNQEMLGLFDASGKEIDKLIFGPQTTDVSQGRSPDGSDTFKFSSLPTPGVTNGSVILTEHNLIDITDIWSYHQSGIDQGTVWREPANATPDTSWPTGAALLYVESSALPAPKSTILTLGKRTYYFRKHFIFDADPLTVTELRISTVIDDGAVIYLNGTEVKRIRMPEGEIVYATEASSPAVGNAVYEYFTIATDNLIQGDNVIAVEVHQQGTSSSDIVFGLAMQATTATLDNLYDSALATYNSLRITELMYNSPLGENYEYIEMVNTGSETIDISGVRITDGIEYTFPPESYLAPDSKIILAADPTIIISYLPDIPETALYGPFSGSLSNSGEQITLSSALPLTAAILRFEYSDKWHIESDGNGQSLNIIDPLAKTFTWRLAESWRAGPITPGE